MKTVKNVLFFISMIIISAFVSSCNGVLFDDIAYVSYPAYPHHLLRPISQRHIPCCQVPPIMAEPNHDRSHIGFESGRRRSYPHGGVQSGRGFNKR